MNMKFKTLDDAVVALLASLDEAKRTELIDVVPTYRFEPGHSWLRRVIDMFDLANSAQELISDIERRFPDESEWKIIESDSDQPVFEAKIILREAQRRLLEQGG